MAGFVELTAEQGANLTTTITVNDSAGDALNLVGYSVASMARKSYASSNSTSFTASVTDASTGLITLEMPASTTANLTSGRYVYDVVITSSADVKTRVIEGILTVLPSVTR